MYSIRNKHGIQISLVLICNPPYFGGSDTQRSRKTREMMVAKFAVTEHNKKANINLQFINVIKCQEQVNSGSLYKVVISAKNGTTSHPKNYEAIVWLRPWEKKDLLTLKSFKKAWCGPCG